MSSLEGCIKKAGPAIRKNDADAIRKIRDDIYGSGEVSRSVANQQAVDEYLAYPAFPRIGAKDVRCQLEESFDSTHFKSNGATVGDPDHPG